MKVGVAKETAPGERRVALVPEVLAKLKAAGLDILVERGAGAGSSIPDSAYQEAGASSFYARNISALLLEMVKDGALNLDFENEVTKATVITKDGAVVSEAVKKLLEPAPAGGGPA